jgi:hypothetical protein
MVGHRFQESRKVQSYLFDYQQQGVLPSPVYFILEEMLWGRSTGEIARKIHSWGVASSPSTLTTQVSALTRFIENSLLFKSNTTITDKIFIHQMSRNRKKEIQLLLKELAVKQKSYSANFVI